MPSANRAKKEDLVASLNQRFSTVGAAVVTHNKGVTVENVTNLRSDLREKGIELKVVKNTLASLAIKGTPMEVLGDHLTGPTVLAYTDEDPVALAKSLSDFAKENPEKFQLLAGMLNGKGLDAAEVNALANVPSREVLLGRLVGSLQGPYAGLVYTLSGVLRKFVYALDAVRRQKEEQGA